MTSFPKDQIIAMCQQYGPQLTLEGIVDWCGNALDPVLVMWAFAGNESSFGANCTPRFEPAYFAGRYAHEPWQEQLNKEYGQDGAKSYGPWQVMLCNCPSGTKPGDYQELAAGAVAFISYMNREIRAQKPQTLDEMGDMYNSGNWHDDNVPEVYIANLRKHYDTPMVEV